MKPYGRGSRTLETKCFCGKMLKSYLAERSHMMMKHPKHFILLKKSGQWDQIIYDWHASGTTPIKN